MTIREIAKKIGVSPSTVSSVLNNRPGVGDEKRAYISEILIENGYEIKPAAAYQSGGILLIRYRSSNHLMDSSDTFFTRIAEGIEATCRSLGYSLTLSMANRDTLPSVLSTASANHISGILFLGSEYEFTDTSILKNQPLPLVSIDNRFSNDKINSVDMDNREGIFAAVQYLHSLGHVKIGYGKSRIQIGSMSERTHAYFNALQDLGLECNPAYVAELSPFSKHASAEFSKYLYEQDSLPTAYIAANDTIAAGMMKAIGQHGLKVPDDISVIGFDDNDICTLLSPQLTTIRIYNFEIGRHAVYRLHQIIQENDNRVIRTGVSVDLILRESVKAL